MDPSAQPTTADNQKEEAPLLHEKPVDDDIESGLTPQKKSYKKYLLLVSVLGLIGIVVTFYVVFGIHDNSQSCSSFSSGESYCISSSSASNMTLMTLGFTDLIEVLCDYEHPNTAKDYAAAMLKRSVQFDDLRAITRHVPDHLLHEAQALDAKRKIEENHGSGLCGTPILIQDNIDTAGIITTGGTKAFGKAKPHSNAPFLQRLIDYGGLVAGKANLDELGQGFLTANPFYGTTKNPYNTAFTTGGAGGGIAAALAARLVSAGVGTDTFGSARIPAALCGVSAFLPTWGRYQQSGFMPLVSLVDSLSPVARTVADVAYLDHLVAEDRPDVPRTYQLNGLKLGVPRAFFYENLDPETERIMNNSLQLFADAGAVLVEVNMSDVIKNLTDDIIKQLWAYECPRDLAHYVYRSNYTIPIMEVFGQGNVMHTAEVDTKWYIDVMYEMRPQMQDAIWDYFDDNGIVAFLTPTTPMPAKKVVNGMVEHNGEMVSPFYYARNARIASWTSFPSLTVPAGLTADGLPVGLEITGMPNKDPTLLGIGRAFEELRGTFPHPPLVESIMATVQQPTEAPVTTEAPTTTAPPAQTGQQPQEGQPQEGQPQEGQPQEGQTQEGQPQEGQPQEGQPQEGQPQEGQPQEGQGAQGAE